MIPVRDAYRAALCGATLFTCASAVAQAGPGNGPIRLGMTTHFAQGWPSKLYDTLARFPEAPVRDELSWGAIEQRTGEYRFTASNSGFVDRLCKMHRKVLLVISPRNRIYDTGLTITTLAAREAFGAFVATVGSRYRDCVEAVEIGNEINGANGLSIPYPDRPVAYTAILKTLYPIVKRRSPDVAVLGGSTNLIGTGFLNAVFAVGALPFLDGVVVHPYRAAPENIDWELARLRAAMEAHGSIKPIWATEFGLADAGSPTSGDYLVQMATLMSAAGVTRAYWYALADDRWFPRMGLATQAGQGKSIASALSYFTRNVAAGRAAVRLGADQSDIFQFAFGADRQVVWGLGRSIIVSGPAVFRDTAGAVIATPRYLSEHPVIVEGPGRLTFGSRVVLADSLYDFARKRLSYSAVADGRLPVTLEPIDGKWTSYLGTPASPLLTVSQQGIRPIGNGPRARQIAIGYRATERDALHVTACFASLPGTRGGYYAVLKNDVQIAAAGIGARTNVDVPLAVMPGDRVTYLIGSTSGFSPLMRYRLRIARQAGLAATC